MNENKRYHNCGQPLEKRNKIDYCPKYDVYIFNQGRINQYESKNPKDISNLTKIMKEELLETRWTEDCIGL